LSNEEHFEEYYDTKATFVVAALQKPPI
jgi:hypothetical protein